MVVLLSGKEAVFMWGNNQVIYWELVYKLKGICFNWENVKISAVSLVLWAEFFIVWLTNGVLLIMVTVLLLDDPSVKTRAAGGGRGVLDVLFGKIIGCLFKNYNKGCGERWNVSCPVKKPSAICQSLWDCNKNCSCSLL